MLNAADYAAIKTAIWAHPQGISYLAKMAQVEALSISCGNPCCNRRVGGYTALRKIQPTDYDSEDLIDLIIVWLANE